MTELTGTTRPVKNRRYPILDALRFFLAFWVTMGHLGIIPIFGESGDATTKLGRLLVHGWNSIVFGTPAVIVFFVISGFCIHLPFRRTEKLWIGRFYARRYTRILIPVAAALVIWRFAGFNQSLFGEHSLLWESPLWSLVCEEFYYAAYPLIRWIRGRYGWAPLFYVTFPLGTGISLLHMHATGWQPYGPIGTALILLPVWLLGCVLAEQSDHLAVLTSTWRIWGWRFLAWFACWACEMLHFKFGIHTGVTMLWFGVLAYFWIKDELAYGLHHSPSRIFVWAGGWSYSLYLVHGAAPEFYKPVFANHIGAIMNWIVYYIFALGISYIFYLGIEKPSHLLARKIRMGPHPPASHPIP